MKRRNILGTLAAAVATAVVGVGAAVPAQAAVTYPLIVPCTTLTNGHSCTTSEVPAKFGVYAVGIQVIGQAGTRWRVWDTANGVQVGFGVLDRNYDVNHAYTTAIHGLYGRYRMQIWNDYATYLNTAGWAYNSGWNLPL